MEEKDENCWRVRGEGTRTRTETRTTPRKRLTRGRGREGRGGPGGGGEEEEEEEAEAEERELAGQPLPRARARACISAALLAHTSGSQARPRSDEERRQGAALVAAGEFHRDVPGPTRQHLARGSRSAGVRTHYGPCRRTGQPPRTVRHGMAVFDGPDDQDRKRRPSTSRRSARSR